jgi:hypothetical protein
MKYPSISYKLPTPEGSAVITIVEGEDESIEKIFFTIGKAGSSVNAYCDAIARMIILSLKNKVPITDILLELSEITSDRQLATPSGLTYRSGVEVLYLALSNYNRDKNRSILSSSRRPAQITTHYLGR